MHEWTIRVPSNVFLLSSNQRLHWAVKMRHARELRQLGMALARIHRVPKLQRATITVIVHPGSRTRRLDPSNWADTAKPLIDGIVDAKVLVDDSAKYLPRVSYMEGDRWPKTGVELRITAL